jgi:hypothetical protein
VFAWYVVASCQEGYETSRAELDLIDLAFFLSLWLFKYIVFVYIPHLHHYI